MVLARLELIVLAVALAACGGSAGSAGVGAGGAPTPSQSEPAAQSEAAESEAAESEAAATSVAVASSPLGDILVDGEGQTLYLFLNDDQGDATCDDDCAQTWPPLPGPAAAGTGADASMLATTERTDGAQQVTYNGWPLYYFAADVAAGDTKGQGVGDVWFAVDAAGEAVKKAAADKPAGGRDY